MTAATPYVKVDVLARPTREPALAKDRDWAGLWFNIMESEAGEFVGMRAGQRAPGAMQPAWLFHSHAAYDGLGWFATLLRKKIPSTKIRIPRLKEAERPSLLRQVYALLRLFTRKPQAAAKWNTWDAAWRPPPGGATAGNAVAVYAFSSATTRQFSVVANSQNISLNSLLLATLGRVSEPLLNGGPAFWMVPVNMRGPVKLANVTANHTSYLQIRTGADVTPRQLHEQVKAKLTRLEHWGGWLLANSGRVVGYRGMKWLYRRELVRTKGRPWVGAFSNLGIWENCGEWFVCPPVAKACPLGVGVVICDGVLSLTIDAHPSIARNATWTQTLMDQWVAELNRLIA